MKFISIVVNIIREAFLSSDDIEANSPGQRPLGE